ncbi:MAG: hypothetical protein R2873_11465 [Caldilineaceae bacterium]
MNEQHRQPITDELLSAYIDGDVTEAEQQQVEYAIANDPEVAWQVETLRQTVALLRDLPAVPLARSFVIHEDQVADVLAVRREQAATPHATQSPSIGRRLLAFINDGNLFLRNASALAAALFLAVTLGRTALTGPTLMPMASAPAPMAAESSAAADAEPLVLEAPLQDASDDSARVEAIEEAPMDAPAAEPYAMSEAAATEQTEKTTEKAAEPLPPEATATVRTLIAPETMQSTTADAPVGSGDAPVSEARMVPPNTFVPEAAAEPAAEAASAAASAEIATADSAPPVEESAGPASSEAGSAAAASAMAAPAAESPAESPEESPANQEAERSLLPTATTPPEPSPTVAVAQLDATAAEQETDAAPTDSGVAVYNPPQSAQQANPAARSQTPEPSPRDLWLIAQVTAPTLAILFLVGWLFSRRRTAR